MSIEEEIALGAAALSAIEGIIKAVAGAKSGTTSAADVLAKLNGLQASLQRNDTEADAELAHRFDTSETPEG